MWRWSSPGVHKGVALSISPPWAGKGISGPGREQSLDGTRGVASSCEPSVPISSSELGTGWGAVSRLREVALGLRGHVGRGPPALPLEKEPCFEKCNRSG